MDKYIDKFIELLKGKSIFDVILLSSFLYLMYANSVKDEHSINKYEQDRELDRKKIETTIALTTAINKQNKIFETIEKKNTEFQEKTMKANEKQIDLLEDIKLEYETIKLLFAK